MLSMNNDTRYRYIMIEQPFLLCIRLLLYLRDIQRKATKIGERYIDAEFS